MIDKGIIDEVEVALPPTTVVLNIVSEGRALNVWVHVLTVDELGIEILEELELGDSRIIGGLVSGLLHDVLGHVGNCQVTVD